MSKTDNQTEKQTLLAKMEHDRNTLAEALLRATPQTKTSKGWASTTALAAGAVVGWPRFLKKPMRAMAAVALRDRVSEILNRRHRTRDAAQADPELARLAQLTADLRHATAQAEHVEDVERVRQELDKQVLRIRELRAHEAERPPHGSPLPMTDAGLQAGQPVLPVTPTEPALAAMVAPRPSPERLKP